MLTTNLKVKVHTRNRGYNRKYALDYLERRMKEIDKDREYFQSMFSKYNINLTGKKVLDLAAGVGMDLKILSEFKPKLLIWHDKMQGPYEIARENLKDLDNVIFNKKDLMDLEKYKENSIDFIICRDSLYYIGNDFRFFKEIRRILKPGGYFWGRNNNFRYYKNFAGKNENFLKRMRHYFFDWPLYKITGLRLFSFLPIDRNRLNHLLKKLNFNIVFLKEKENSIEFLIKK